MVSFKILPSGNRESNSKLNWKNFIVIYLQGLAGIVVILSYNFFSS